MTSARLDGPPGAEERKRRFAFPLLVVCVVGAALRIVVGYHGGIWADEGFFLLVAKAPSWSAMIDFLRFHESHPPLFYAMMRIWMSVAGTRDVMELLLPVLIGIVIVPAMYVSGAKLFSRRTGLIAAGLAAISPALIEFSGQLRPYGLLPLLTLTSCASLAMAIKGSGLRRWAWYVASTSMLLYTHNWTWLIFGGQIAAVVALSFGVAAISTNARRNVLLCWAVILIMYSPWWSTLLFQVQHAGHPALVVRDWTRAVEFTALALPAALVMSLFGSLSEAGAALMIVALIASIAGLLLVSIDLRTKLDRLDVTARIFLTVSAVSILAVIALSSRTNLLLPRCIAMLSPLLIMLVARLVDTRVLEGSQRNRSTVSGVIVAMVIVVSIFGTALLTQTTRSNVREVAVQLSRVARPSDLVIVVPEWYAASFTHYFRDSLEEIDYPNPGRGGMVDFSHVFERVIDDAPMATLGARIRTAKASGQRVWLITGRAYSTNVSSQQLANAMMYHQSPILSVRRAAQIRDSLRLAFGAPDTTMFIHGQKPRYDEVLPYLYLPNQSTDPSARMRR